MRTIITPTLAILAAFVLVGSIGAISLQQQASAIIIICSVQKIADFQQLTAQVQKAVLKESPDPHLIGDFSKLTAQLKRDVINATMIGDTSAIRGFIVNWHDAALRIFPDEPDTIPRLIESYSQEVLSLFTGPE